MAQRRTKIEVLNEKISKVDSKIAAYTEKIAALEDEKTALELSWMRSAKLKKKAKEATELKRLLKLMHKKRHFRGRSGIHDLQGRLRQILNE